MKKFNYFITSIIFCLMPIIVWASENDIQEIKDVSALKECIDTSGFCKLGSRIQLHDVLTVSREVDIDLNGQTLTPDSEFKRNGGFIVVEHGAKLTINDSKGTGKISTGTKENSDVWGAIQLATKSDSGKVAELVVNGGSIEGYYYGVVGNGNIHNTKITVNGGSILGLNAEDSVGVYHPQQGDITVNGGSIRGGTGIEMRSGTLTVNEGKIEGIAPKFIKVVTAGGSTTNGVGVAVAQHTTKNPITVKINGGDISGQYAFYEWNPHKNTQSELEKINLQISGGNFVGTADGVSTVYSEDFTKFISGGKFNKSVSKYLTDDAEVVSRDVDGEIKDGKEDNGKSHWGLFIGASLLAVLGAVGFTIYKKVR